MHFIGTFSFYFCLFMFDKYHYPSYVHDATYSNISNAEQIGKIERDTQRTVISFENKTLT